MAEADQTDIGQTGGSAEEAPLPVLTATELLQLFFNPLFFFDWGELPTENAVLRNAVSVLQAFDDETRTMTYLTGGSRPDEDGQAAVPSRNQAAPVRIVAAESIGQVTVQVRTTDDRSSAQESRQYAQWLARATHLATTEIWPAEVVPVVVDVYLMDMDAPYSWARRIEWADGDPFRVAIFRRNLVASYPEAVHELYHLLAARWSIGWRGQQTAATNRGFAFEEVAANLYSQCAALLAIGTLRRPAVGFNVVLNGRSIRYPPLRRPDLEYMLDLLTRSDESTQDGLRSATQFGAALREIPVLEIVGEEPEISFESSAGRELISLCRDVSPEPMRMENWFESLLASP